MNVRRYTDWYTAAFPIPTARYEVVNQHACGPREALFASMSQVCILRRNWIIFPGLLRALIRKPLLLPNYPARVLVCSNFRNAIFRAA